MQPTDVFNNPPVPNIDSLQFNPDQLIAGQFPIITGNVTVTGGAIFKRGSVLGRITASGLYTLVTAAATDGSQNPSVVLVMDVDATAGDVIGGVYKTGEFNKNKLILGTGVTLDAIEDPLRIYSIFLKDSVSAAGAN